MPQNDYAKQDFINNLSERKIFAKEPDISENKEQENPKVKQPPFHIIERFADNGAHSHWELLNDQHETLWMSGNAPLSPVVKEETQIILDAVKYGFDYRDNSQHQGEVPKGNILQWLQWRKSPEYAAPTPSPEEQDKEVKFKNKFLKTAELKDLENQVTEGQISYSRMVEILNEKAAQYFYKPLQSKVEGEDWMSVAEKALTDIAKRCEDSGLKMCDTENKIHMAVYLSLHTAKEALKKLPQPLKEV